MADNPHTPSDGRAPAGAAPAAALNPFLHVSREEIHDPTRGRSLRPGEPGEQALRALLGGGSLLALTPVERRTLRAGGWLVDPAADLSTRFHLRFVLLETHTVCNQACYFCPVSVAPRPRHFMPTELFSSIVGQLAPLRATLEGVALINYNEPTVDPRFVELVGALLAAGLPAAVVTNGSGLTPARVDALLELGRLRYLSVNLSTLDADEYRRTRGADQLRQVLAHLDYVSSRPLADEMDIAVLGDGGDAHRANHAAIERRFAGSRFQVRFFRFNDRAGWLPIGAGVERPHRRLRGCDHMGSRPFQHLHVTPQGRCVLCCQDYSETVVVGDLTRQSVEEVLSGPGMAAARRRVYGLEPSPDDWICRRCPFALADDGGRDGRM